MYCALLWGACVQVLCSLAACATVTDERVLSPGVHQFSMDNNVLIESPGAEFPMMSGQATKYCPLGYEQVKRKVSVKGNIQTYTWVIKCLEE